MKEIIITNNYEQFKKLEGNREVGVGRVDKIKRSILQVGYITSPILVNENMEIIDGQGRFEALRELRMPIEYIVQPGLNIKECIAMNIYQTNWNLMDYIKSYADKGVKDYVYLVNLMKEFPAIKGIYAYAIALFETGTLDTQKTRNGEIQISEQQYEAAREKLRYVYPIAQQYGHITRLNCIINGMLYCTYIESIDLKRLKEKICKVLEVGKIPPMPTTEEAMQFLEEVYNKNKKGDSLYIYTEYRKEIEEIKRRGTRAFSEKMKQMYSSFAIEE